MKRWTDLMDAMTYSLTSDINSMLKPSSILSPHNINVRLITFLAEKPKKVIFNPPATVVIWPDGTKTVAKCEPGETYDKEKGLMVAMLKRAYGNRAFHDIMEENIGYEGEKADA